MNITVGEKARALLSELEGVSDSGAIVKRLALALKEQDRDTRHKCAEAINALRWETTGVWGLEGEAVVSRDEAHAACMNVKAV